MDIFAITEVDEQGKRVDTLYPSNSHAFYLRIYALRNSQAPYIAYRLIEGKNGDTLVGEYDASWIWFPDDEMPEGIWEE